MKYTLFYSILISLFTMGPLCASQGQPPCDEIQKNLLGFLNEVNAFRPIETVADLREFDQIISPIFRLNSSEISSLQLEPILDRYTSLLDPKNKALEKRAFESISALFKNFPHLISIETLTYEKLLSLFKRRGMLSAQIGRMDELLLERLKVAEDTNSLDKLEDECFYILAILDHLRFQGENVNEEIKHRFAMENHSIAIDLAYLEMLSNENPSNDFTDFMLGIIKKVNPSSPPMFLEECVAILLEKASDKRVIPHLGILKKMRESLYELGSSSTLYADWTLLTDEEKKRDSWLLLRASCCAHVQALERRAERENNPERQNILFLLAFRQYSAPAAESLIVAILDNNINKNRQFPYSAEYRVVHFLSKMIQDYPDEDHKNLAQRALSVYFKYNGYPLRAGMEGYTLEELKVYSIKRLALEAKEVLKAKRAGNGRSGSLGADEINDIVSQIPEDPLVLFPQDPSKRHQHDEIAAMNVAGLLELYLPNEELAPDKRKRYTLVGKYYKRAGELGAAEGFQNAAVVFHDDDEAFQSRDIPLAIECYKLDALQGDLTSFIGLRDLYFLYDREAKTYEAKAAESQSTQEQEEFREKKKTALRYKYTAYLAINETANLSESRFPGNKTFLDYAKGAQLVINLLTAVEQNLPQNAIDQIRSYLTVEKLSYARSAVSQLLEIKRISDKDKNLLKDLWFNECCIAFQETENTTISSVTSSLFLMLAQTPKQYDLCVKVISKLLESKKDTGYETVLELMTHFSKERQFIPSEYAPVFEKLRTYYQDKLNAQKNNGGTNRKDKKSKKSAKETVGKASAYESKLVEIKKLENKIKGTPGQWQGMEVPASASGASDTQLTEFLAQKGFGAPVSPESSSIPRGFLALIDDFSKKTGTPVSIYEREDGLGQITTATAPQSKNAEANVKDNSSKKKKKGKKSGKKAEETKTVVATQPVAVTGPQQTEVKDVDSLPAVVAAPEPLVVAPTLSSEAVPASAVDDGNSNPPEKKGGFGKFFNRAVSAMPVSHVKSVILGNGLSRKHSIYGSKEKKKLAQTGRSISKVTLEKAESQRNEKKNPEAPVKKNVGLEFLNKKLKNYFENLELFSVDKTYNTLIKSLFADIMEDPMGTSGKGNPEPLSYAELKNPRTKEKISVFSRRINETDRLLYIPLPVPETKDTIRVIVLSFKGHYNKMEKILKSAFDYLFGNQLN